MMENLFLDDIDHCTKILEEGKIILYPTDTVWGIGADATNGEAIQKIFSFKKRHDSKALVSLVYDLEMLKSMTKVSTRISSILSDSDKPTTIIYEKVKTIHPSALAKNGSAAIRIPNDDFCKALLKAFKKPIISTSANISGAPTPRNFSLIDSEISSQVDYVVRYEQQNHEEKQASRILKISGDNISVIRD